MNQSKELTPEWLNTSFLQSALISYKGDETIEVLNFDIRTDFTDHFSSDLFQSKIEFKSETNAEPEVLNVVIKAEPIGNGIKSRVVGGGPLFETEIRMYTETLPSMQQLFKRNGLNVEFSPE